METVEKELGKTAGMRLNVSLITDGCDNMLSKVLALFPPKKSSNYKCCRCDTSSMCSAGSVSSTSAAAT